LKAEKVAAEMRATTKKPGNYGKNLGAFLVPKGAKMPSGSKIGAASTSKKTAKAKLLKTRAQKGAHVNV
jgi:hypothetical protein